MQIETSPPRADTGQGLVPGVVEAITGHIRAHALGPGDRLPSEAEFGKELGVSRTVVREAFRSLAALRLIELNAGRRATVAPFDISALSPLIEHGVHTEQISIQQIYDVRRTIESRTAALAAMRRTEPQAATIMALATGMRDAFDDLPAMMEQDIALHREIAEAACNPVFALIVCAFDNATRQTWPIGWRSRTDEAEQQAMVELHISIAKAVEAGDPLSASKMMGRHFDASVAALLAAGLV